MSDKINKYQTGKIYKTGSPKAKFIHEYLKQYISDITESPHIILPNANDFIDANDYIHQLFVKFTLLSNKHYELSQDTSKELKTIDSHRCFHNKTPFNTDVLDSLNWT